jgi:hypothetical protein
MRAKKRRHRLRFWLRTSASYAALLAAVYAALYVALGAEGGNLAAELEACAESITQSRRRMHALRGKLQDAVVELKANRAVGNQPDWSVLLAAVSGRLGDDVFLRRCRLSPRRGAEHPAPEQEGGAPARRDAVAAGQNRYTLRLEGYGKSLRSVSQFVLRLEGHVLFDKVRIVRTSREPLLTSTAVAFELECPLGGEAGPSGEETAGRSGRG